MDIVFASSFDPSRLDYSETIIAGLGDLYIYFLCLLELCLHVISITCTEQGIYAGYT